MASRNPTTWDDYERGLSGSRNDSVSTIGGRSVTFATDDESPLREGDEDGQWPQLRRRRSSVTNRLAALTDMGGVNSIRSFTRSWQRAAGFAEVIPQRPAFVLAGDQPPLHGPGSSAEDISYGRENVPQQGHAPRTSLLRQHFEAGESPPAPGVEGGEAAPAGSSGTPGPEAEQQPLLPGDFRDRERKGSEAETLDRKFSLSHMGSGTGRSSIFAIPPHLATPPLMGSYGSYRSGYGSHYGAVDDVASPPPPPMSIAQAEALWLQQQESGANVPDGELEPILVKEVEEDGKIMLRVEGQSTLPQTIFNSINVLIGVGLLSLPMGIKYAGWLCGMVILFLSAAVTAYTARLLTKCMDLDPIVITFSDLAFISFGPRARLATSVLFTLELLAACVALIVLFADSLNLLFPGALTLTEWKVVCAFVLMPLNFLPLRLLSFTSIIGILSCFGIVAIVVADGLLKTTTPGSLIEPATTYLFPANWLTLPLSFGLLMSPWGGHSVFPNIYRDMRHPHKYPKAVTVTFSFAYLLDAITAVAGLLMFGDGVMEEITSNILTTSGYPRVLTYLLCAFIAITPLTKIPLNARPIITTIEVLTGLHQQSLADAGPLVGRSMYFRGLSKIVIRVATIVVFLVMAIAFPEFDTIMAFMGSALCFTICVTLPLAFYLKLFSKDITAKERFVACTVMTLSMTLSIVGTVWAFLPKSLVGAS